MEDGGFQNQRMLKRRLMEAQCGAEVRRLHIVYFLSRKGYNEHPHLVRVHHLSRNGVRLRDVKRWLGELRGKNMPESFAWSHKRRYRTGYVWQDLVDDDLITPISDNEYVLKGSEISSTIINNIEASSKELENHSPSSEIEESSTIFGSETSTLTDDMNSKKDDEVHNNNSAKIIKQENSSPFRPTLDLNKKKNKKVKINEKKGFSTTPASSNNMRSISDHYKTRDFTKSSSCANGALFKNLITCGGVDTNDSAVVMTNKKKNRAFLNMCSKHEKNVHAAAICKREIKPQNMFVTTPNWTQNQWNNSKSCGGAKDSAKKKGQFRELRTPAAAHKPFSRPNCSQCGKPFKPEKLHAHMKSCKGMKTASNPKSANNTSHISTESRKQGSISTYFPTH